jgi:hypothetical protein
MFEDAFECEEEEENANYEERGKSEAGFSVLRY